LILLTFSTRDTLSLDSDVSLGGGDDGDGSFGGDGTSCVDGEVFALSTLQPSSKTKNATTARITMTTKSIDK
jgi:hypothetical protein